MQKVKNINKKELKLFLIILILASFLCLGFLIPHKITDSYWNIEEGYDAYKITPLKDGRLIHYIILSIVSNLKIPMETWLIISQYISLILYSISILNVYKVVIDIIDKKIKKDVITKNINYKAVKIITLLSSLLIILNPMTVECFAYVENIIMSLSILIITYASKIFFENKKNSYKKTLILMLLASLCYQGTLNMWILLSMLFFILNDGNKKLKDWIRYLVKIASITFILLIFMVCTLKCIELFTHQEQERIASSKLDIGKTIYLIIIQCVRSITIDTFGLFPKYFICYIIIIAIVLLYIFSSKDAKSPIFKYLFFIFIVLLSCILPIFLQKVPAISARISVSIGGIIGSSIIYILYNALNNKTNKISYILLAIAIIYFLVNIIDYYKLAIMNQITLKEEKNYCEKINEYILDYEKNSKYIVTNVAFTKDIKVENTYKNLPANTFTHKAVLANYSNIHCLNYYTKRNLNKVEMRSEIYEQYFKGKNWDEFNEEQIKFDKDTMYICLY